MSSTYVRGLVSSASSLPWNRSMVSQMDSHLSWTERGSHFSADCPPDPPAVCWWPAAATSALSTAVIVSSRFAQYGSHPALALSLVSKKPLGHEGQPPGPARLSRSDNPGCRSSRSTWAYGGRPSLIGSKRGSFRIRGNDGYSA